MAGLSLDDLPIPARDLRVDIVPGSKFETEAVMQEEDQKRARMLLNPSGRSAAERRACKLLARRIRRAARDETSTLASASSQRGYRVRLIGGLLHLCRGRRTYLVTLIPRGFEVTPEGLADVNPKNLTQWLRVTLRRCGATANTRGWIYAYLEGEYNPATGMIQLHWHLIVRGDAMHAAVEGLRQHSRFRRVVGAVNNPDSIDVRVMVQQVRQRTMPQTIGYTTKGAWYSKWRAIDENSNRSSQSGKCRIPEPVHSKVLLWLDRWKVGDMAMLLNLHVTKNGITPR
jgi:hypothetical protein